MYRKSGQSLNLWRKPISFLSRFRDIFADNVMFKFKNGRSKERRIIAEQDHTSMTYTGGDVDLDDLGGTLADGMQQWLLDTLEVDAVKQQVDGLHGLAVDGQMQRTAAHVVDTVDVQLVVAWRRLVERLADYRHVTKRRRVQVNSLFIRQLHTPSLHAHQQLFYHYHHSPAVLVTYTRPQQCRLKRHTTQQFWDKCSGRYGDARHTPIQPWSWTLGILEGEIQFKQTFSRLLHTIFTVWTITLWVRVKRQKNPKEQITVNLYATPRRRQVCLASFWRSKAVCLPSHNPLTRLQQRPRPTTGSSQTSSTGWLFPLAINLRKEQLQEFSC